MMHLFTDLSYVKYLFLAAYCLYAFFATNKGKPLVWMVGHVVAIAAGGWAIFSHLEWYLVSGMAAVVAGFVQQVIAKQITKANLSATLLAAGKNLLFFPVSFFEQMYSAITTQKPTV